MKPLRMGISTCPNDTFAFHAILEKKVDLRGLNWDIELLDIQTLNDQLFEGRFSVAKASFHAALLLAQKFWVLPSGSALGFGVGPLLLASQPHTHPSHVEQLTLCPGQHTTAALLFQLFYPNRTRVEHVVFSDIMPRLQSHQAEFGVCIHEGRFTWEQAGLYQVEDLGTRWERETGLPLPLGGIVASRCLDHEQVTAIQNVIRDSLGYALENPSQAIATMRKYAQEMDDSVLMKHVELYVNPWTIDLGDTGQAALDELSRRARHIGIVRDETERLTVFSPKIKSL